MQLPSLELLSLHVLSAVTAVIVRRAKLKRLTRKNTTLRKCFCSLPSLAALHSPLNEGMIDIGRYVLLAFVSYTLYSIFCTNKTTRKYLITRLYPHPPKEKFNDYMTTCILLFTNLSILLYKKSFLHFGPDISFTRSNITL